MKIILLGKKNNIIVNKSDHKINNLIYNSTFKLNIKDSQKSIVFNNLENKLKKKDTFESKFKNTLFPFNFSIKRSCKRNEMVYKNY